MTTKTVKASKPAFKMLEGAKAIDTAIKSISTRGKTLEKDIHIAAVSCLNHADLHGDITLAQKLVEAVPTMARKNALRDWFLAHGKFSYDTTEKTLTYNKKAATLLQEAMDTPFWTFKPEQEYVPFDINAAINALVKRAEKAKENGDKVPDDALNALRKLAA